MHTGVSSLTPLPPRRCLTCQIGKTLVALIQTMFSFAGHICSNGGLAQIPTESRGTSLLASKMCYSGKSRKERNETDMEEEWMLDAFPH